MLIYGLMRYSERLMMREGKERIFLGIRVESDRMFVFMVFGKK